MGDPGCGEAAQTLSRRRRRRHLMRDPLGPVAETAASGTCVSSHTQGRGPREVRRRPSLPEGSPFTLYGVSSLRDVPLKSLAICRATSVSPQQRAAGDGGALGALLSAIEKVWSRSCTLEAPRSLSIQSLPECQSLNGVGRL